MHGSPEVDRPADAAQATGEAVTVYRELDAAIPGRYGADLAAALTDLGIWLSGLGRPEDALAAGQEALTIRRELAAAGPESSRADLASCLVTLGVWFSELGRPEDALVAEQEAVTIRRVLAAFAPARYRPTSPRRWPASGSRCRSWVAPRTLWPRCRRPLPATATLAAAEARALPA